MKGLVHQACLFLMLLSLPATTLGEQHPALVVGSKKFTESVILGEILRQVVADTGHPVEHHAELGDVPEAGVEGRLRAIHGAALDGSAGGDGGVAHLISGIGGYWTASYCSGDEPGTCPCNNDNDGSLPGAGCANGVYASGALLTGSGGWPMSVFLTPDQRPFFGGTYIPRQAFLELLERILAVWAERRADLERQAGQVTQRILAELQAGSGGKLSLEIAEQVIAGIAEGCVQAGCALIGGETAEMPGMYQADDFDLAGFCVGIVDKDRIIDGHQVQPGNTLIALASSGPHSNGYSLIRKVIEVSQADLQQDCGGVTLGQALLHPTRIYCKNLLAVAEQQPILAIAHITGGGLIENIPRVLPDHCAAEIDLNSWQMPAVFEWLQRNGNIEQQEMLRTFNCGIGMVLAVDETAAEACLAMLNGAGEQAWKVGRIVAKSGDDAVLFTS